MTLESPMLSTRKVAEMLRISPKAVRGLIAKGELHPLRPWHHWRFHRTEIESLLAAKGGRPPSLMIRHQHGTKAI